MRIATWNVEYAYPNRLGALQRVVSENDADVWVLTETHDDLVPSGTRYAAHSEPRPKNWSGIRPGSRWVSIWSRWPILAKVSLPEADLERTVAALIDVGSQKLLVYGTVLPWKGDRGKFDWSEHHRIIPMQCAEWLKLHKEHSDASLCVAGDYNTDMGTGILRDKSGDRDTTRRAFRLRAILRDRPGACTRRPPAPPSHRPYCLAAGVEGSRVSRRRLASVEGNTLGSQRACDRHF